MTTEALFYHLTERSLEAALPELLEKTLARGWRAVVRVGAAERVEALDRALWTYRDDSFLPHGAADDGAPGDQPIYLTAGAEVPNGAQALFLVAGAMAAPAEMRAFARVVAMFDGRDDDAVAGARDLWKAATEAGLKAVYWAQADGRWIKRAESG